MKFTTTFIAALAITGMLSCMFFVLQPDLKLSLQDTEYSGPESPINRMEWEKSRYADPATGRIPHFAIWDAYQQLIADGKISAQPFISKATNRTGEWQLVNDFFSSIAITKMCYDPQQLQTYYFCTGEGWYNADAAIGAGVWKSIDAGNSWQQLPATDTSLFSYCQDIDVHPATSDIYVATSASGLMRSQDGGSSFNKVLHVPGSQNNSICDVEFTKNGSIFATTGIFQAGAVYYS